MHCCVGDLKGSFIPMRVVYPNLCSTEHQRKCCKKKLFAICQNQMNRHPVMQKKQTKIQNRSNLRHHLVRSFAQPLYGLKIHRHCQPISLQKLKIVEIKLILSVCLPYITLLLYFCGGVWVGVVLASENPHLQDRNSEIWSHNSWNERWAL